MSVSEVAKERVRRVFDPLTDFLHEEAAGGLVLAVATVAALLWANSPVADSYGSFWHTELSIGAGSLSISEDLQHWVNDALMALFFFVVGLEIKRELVAAELRDSRAAALPVIAAAGGASRRPPSSSSSPGARPKPTAGRSRWRRTSPLPSASSRCSATASQA